MKVTHQPPDNLEEYKKEFGSVGVQLHAAVCKARATNPTQSSSNQTVTQTSKFSNNEINIYIFLLNFFLFYIDAQSKTAVGRPVPTTTSNNSANPQKYVLMSQRPVATQVNIFYCSKRNILLINCLFQNPSSNKTIYISQQNIKSEFQDPNN